MKSFAEGSRHRLKFIALIFFVQLAFAVVLVAWWGFLLLDQADQIQRLEVLAGTATEASGGSSKYFRMVFAEAAWFLAVILISGLVLLRLYMRDIKRSRGLQTFFASLTHELKTPLTSIRLQAESIADATANDSYTKALADRLLEDTSRLEGQVERTLELARVEGGGPVLSQGLPIKPLVARMLDSWRENQLRNIQVKLDLGEDSVIGDSSAIQIILRNLLDNSLKHSKRDDVAVIIRSLSVADQVVLHYQDNGVSSSEQTEKLGELFVKGPESNGAGVGLYLVTALMKKMGGKADFDFNQGFHADLYFRRGEVHG